MILNELKLDRRIKDIFISNNWTNPYEVFLNLEAYKFLTEEEIISIFKDIFLVEITSLSEINKTEFIKKGNYFYKELANKDIEIVWDPFTELDEGKLSLDVDYRDLKVLYVTPYTLNKITENKVEWEYSAIFKRLVMECIDVGGTDIHIICGHDLSGNSEYSVKFRIGNDLEDCNLFKMDKTMNSGLINTIVHSHTNTYVGDLNGSYGVTGSSLDLFGDGKISIRVSANKVFGGYKCICRIQQISTTSLLISELGFPLDVQKDLIRVSKKSGGLTLITGAFRTGKNTTGFAIMNEMSKKPISIQEYSSPIETLMPFPQIDYKSDVDYLIELVKQAKKQDINVVFLNEIPDKEVARPIQDLVNSSVHVVTTFHLNRLWHLPYKLKEYFGDEFKNIISQLNMVMNQKMFIKQCEHCRASLAVSGLDDNYREKLEAINCFMYYQSMGCDHCTNKNYRVKVQPYVERLVFTDELISNLLSVDKPYDMELILRKEINSRGLSLEYSMAEGVKKGEIHPREFDILGG